MIWIDAVCISQSDPKERGEQAKLMQRIYKRATSLAVWLGIEKNGNSKAIALLSAISKELDRQPSESFCKLSIGKVPANIMSPAEIGESWSTLKALFARPWFMRVWVLQDFALGGHDASGEDAIIFCCGQTRTSRLVDSGHRMFTAESVGSLTCSEEVEPDKAVVFHARTLALSHLPKLGACRTLYKFCRPKTQQDLNLYRLLPLVIISRDTIATDPRDKIYIRLLLG